MTKDQGEQAMDEAKERERFKKKFNPLVGYFDHDMYDAWLACAKEKDAQISELSSQNEALKESVNKSLSIADEKAMLVADNAALRQQIERLTKCQCGRELSPGTCNVCDNDD